MSEELLKTIVNLFAIVSRDRISEDIQSAIRDFLGRHLAAPQIATFLSIFESYSKSVNQKELSAEVARVADKVNHSLTYQQKMVILITVINLIDIDGFISEEENQQLKLIAASFNISESDLEVMIRFVDGGDIEELSSENILIIDDGRETHSVKGPRIISRHLNGLVSILKIRGTDSYFIKYIGISHLQLNGIRLKSRKVEIFPTGSTLRGTRIEPIYYSKVVSKFVNATEHELTFEAGEVYYYFKNGKPGLQNINFSESGGRLIGLMGASGAGKSTLLNVLNGTEVPQQGAVTINGIDIHRNPEKVAGVMGFIPQDDLLIEELSVFENLSYAARLCFGDYSEKQVTELVNRVLSSLGLVEIQHLKVGSVMDKTISGGQRKRVNIGLELLREPMVLFVDEPTSGLSSRDSENIMDLMKELSLRGKMIFVVIHQPSSDIFKMFDSLFILDVGGLPIYYGNPVEAITYFQEIIDATSKNQGECPQCGNVNPEQIFDIIETRVVNEYGRLTETRKISPAEWNSYFEEKIAIPKIEESSEQLPQGQHVPNWLSQWKVFLSRDIFTKLSNRQYMFINILEAPVLAAFIAYLVKYYAVLNVDVPEYTFYQNDNIPVFYFMSVVVVLFSGLTMSAEEIFRDRKILKREHYLNLSRSSYLTAKITVMFLFSAFQTLLFFLVGNLILEIPLTAFRFWLILFSSSCFANLLGLNISSAFNSAVTIYILIPILLIPQLLLSGVVVNFEKFNPKLGGMDRVPLIGELMVSRWAFEAFMVTQFKDNPVRKVTYPMEQSIANNQYRANYFIPVLESKLESCRKFLVTRNDSAEYESNLTLIGNEIDREINRIGVHRDPVLDRLHPDKFDSIAYQQVDQLLTNLKGYYLNELKRLKSEEDVIMTVSMSSPSQVTAFEQLRNTYQNKAVADIVKNLNTTNRIVEVNGQLLQRVYPVYLDDHRPRHILDFRGNFYIPTKPFLGYQIDTLYFNLIVIWLMTLILYVTLYFDLLKKLISFGRN